MKIQDVIKKFKFEKFHILMKTQCHSSWRADCPRNWRNRKGRRQSNNVSAAAYNNGFSKEPTALWCYSMIIYIKGTVVDKTIVDETVGGETVEYTTFVCKTEETVDLTGFCGAPPNSPVL